MLVSAEIPVAGGKSESKQADSPLKCGWPEFSLVGTANTR